MKLALVDRPPHMGGLTTSVLPCFYDKASRYFSTTMFICRVLAVVFVLAHRIRGSCMHKSDNSFRYSRASSFYPFAFLPSVCSSTG